MAQGRFVQTLARLALHDGSLARNTPTRREPFVVLLHKFHRSTAGTRCVNESFGVRIPQGEITQGRNKTNPHKPHPVYLSKS
jgi:hypothetical protein